MAHLHQGLAAYRATGAKMAQSYLLAFLAETYGAGGQPKAGLEVLDEALTAVRDTGERMYEAELYRLQGELLRVQSLVRKTIVVVTHDIDEALRLGDRVVLMRMGGRIAQVATPGTLLAHPASDFVAGFLGGDRTLRRLALVPLRSAELRPADGAAPVERVDAAASLRDALEAVLRSPDGRAAVVDGDRVLGVADSEVIRRAAAAG